MIKRTTKAVKANDVDSAWQVIFRWRDSGKMRLSDMVKASDLIGVDLHIQLLPLREFSKTPPKSIKAKKAKAER